MRYLFVLLGFTACLWGNGKKALCGEDFASAETCKGCHKEIYQQWNSSFHSKASTDSLFWRLFRQADLDSGSRATSLCLTCHAPVATVGREVAWFGPIPPQLELSPVGKEGVTCDFCHTVSGREELGRGTSLGAYRVPRAGTTLIKYGSRPDARSSAHEIRTSAFLRSSQFCGICHQSTHPLPGLEIQNTLAEWVSSPYSATKQECQQCHMPSYTGRGTDNSPERQDVRAHVFAGGHTGMVKKAALVSLSGKVSGKNGNGKVRVDAMVTNAGAGHMMPTGVPGLRQLWLELAVKGPDGAEVYNGRSDFGLKLVDRSGSPALPWKAARVASDTRLAPQRPRRESFEFPATGAALAVRATLYYRLVSEQAAGSAGIEPSTPIRVAQDEILIAADGTVKKVAVP